MTDRLSLPPRYRRMVEELLREHVPDAEARHLDTEIAKNLARLGFGAVEEAR